MGYRSDVMAAFYVNTTEDRKADALLAMRAWYMLKKGECGVQDKSSAEWLFDNFREVKRGYVFEVDNVKWYDSYEEVQMFDALVTSFKEAFIENTEHGADHGYDETDYGYEFVRIGEEDDDIHTENDGANDWVLRLERNILCDI
jgi:hypothetical protein